ncbi:MAG TPA: hypothetical protein VGA13_05165 [Acidimicrobiales bacterium]
MVSTSQPQPDEFALLLDQGFPKPTAFAISALDQSVRVDHLSDFAPELAENSTPDWYVYCAAAEAGYNALVVRDRSQLDQLAEMYALSRLSTLTVVTWRKGIEDPVREWGQLLAYLPQVKQRCLEAGGRAILLPAPSLGNDPFHDPKQTLAGEAQKLGMSVAQVRAEAKREITDWLEITGEPSDRFDDLLDA